MIATQFLAHSCKQIFLNISFSNILLFDRYLSTAVVINKSSRRNVMLDLVKVIQEESYTYRDPITSFIEDLYVKFDFESAQQKLRECEAVLSTDFFLVACLQVRT